MKRALVKEELNILEVALLDSCSIVNWRSLALSQGGSLDSAVCMFFWLVDEASIGGRSDCATTKDFSKTHSLYRFDSSTWAIWT